MFDWEILNSNNQGGLFLDNPSTDQVVIDSEEMGQKSELDILSAVGDETDKALFSQAESFLSYRNGIHNV
jgi:hypothetical protein